MEDHKSLNIKFKLTKLPAVTTPPPPQQQRDDCFVVVDDELEEGEIREQLELELEPGEVNAELGKYDCKYCFKPFTNGKALGGHLRIHAAERDKQPASTITKKPKPAGSSSSLGLRAWDQEDKPFKCTYLGCPKSYWSQKALFGHMRSHPDREYRGMEPPSSRVRNSNHDNSNNNNNNNNSESDGDDDDDDSSPSQAVNRLEGLLNWKVVGKRGQTVDPSMESGSSSSNTDRYDEVAATDLMLFLANDPPRKSTPQEDGDGDENGDRDRDGVRAIIKKREEKKKGEYDEDELYFLQDYFGITVPPSPPMKFDYPSTKSTNKKKRKAIKGSEPIQAKHQKKADDNQDDDVEMAVTETGPDGLVFKWICTTCGKAFLTHQALGGHRSSHNKEKASQKKSQSKSNPNPNPDSPTLTLTLNQPPTPTQTQIESGSGLTQVWPGSEGGSSEINGDVADTTKKVVVVVGGSSSSSLHKCNICNESFQSGQVLGGHMRCHYVSSPESSPVRTSPQTGRRSTVFEIDLNISILTDEEDADGVVEST